MKKAFIVTFVTLFLFFGCGGDKSRDSGQKTSEATTSGLTQFELENGIGPIKEKLQLGPIDTKLAAKGEEIWKQKCSACHKLNERYIGPAHSEVLKRRTPEFVMNMMLNPEEMQKKHPEVKKLLAEYLSVMPNQNLTLDDARAVLEFLRLSTK
jgi:mono/diheme cytochrome c family protein